MSAGEYSTGLYKTWYSNDYVQGFANVKGGIWDERSFLRSLFAHDLWFLVCYGMGVAKAHHPFVVEICRDISCGPSSMTLDVYAREHFKSLVITQGETLQYHLKNPDKCTGIFAYARPPAKAFLRSLKILLEQSDLLKWCFPDVLWSRPEVEAPKWSEDDGLLFKRPSTARKESTIEAWGLIEGMPTGRHFERRVYDDIETDDIRESPDMLRKCYEKFEMSDNLGVDGGVERVIGTFYSHFGPIVKLRDKKDHEGNPMYLTRVRPATDDGTRTGRPILLSQERLDKLKMSIHFNSQQLCDPTPVMDMRLDFGLLRPIDPKFLPKDRLKFILIDPAGDDSVQKGNKNDSWAMGCISVSPVMDDLGTSAVYIEDVIVDAMPHSTAIDAACRLYTRNGRITALGVEKVGTDTTYVHIQNALKAQGRHLVIKRSETSRGNLVLLSPDGKKKESRIETSLSWPLSNGKIFYSTSLPAEIIEAIREEMNKFPFYHVDILDMISYVYKLLEFCRFSFSPEEREDEEDDTPLVLIQGRSAVGGY